MSNYQIHEPDATSEGRWMLSAFARRELCRAIITHPDWPRAREALPQWAGSPRKDLIIDACQALGIDMHAYGARQVPYGVVDARIDAMTRARQSGPRTRKPSVEDDVKRLLKEFMSVQLLPLVQQVVELALDRRTNSQEQEQ